MATITYNNLSSPANLITLTDIPNILKVSDVSGGTHARIYLSLSGDLSSVTTKDGQWYITVMDETITNVTDPKNAINKNFYISPLSNNSTAASIARALRNCPTIAANFTVKSDGDAVILRAYGVGKVWKDGQTVVNMSSGLNTYVSTASTSNGTAYSSLQGALIDVDVYDGLYYVTTLEKSWYDGEAAFDMSPILTTIAKPSKTVEYSFNISSIKDGEYNSLGTIENNFVSVGYMCNQGYKYLVLDDSNPTLAMNVSRGKSREYSNNTILYLYQPSIRMSVYGYSNVRPNIEVKYYDSAYNMLYNTSTQNWTITNNDSLLSDLRIDLNTTYFNQAFYIKVDIGSEISLWFDVIKPLKATEYSQRILWRNSYGGISFFDFTGQKTETRDVKISTYQKNIFGYYSDTMNELEKIYDNDVTYTVSLKSHLFAHDGKYIFNDLIQSSQVWTEINGETYAIILDSVSVEETDRNDVYEATVKYHYSQEPSLI